MADTTRADLIDSLVDELLASEYLDQETKDIIGGLRLEAKEDLKRMPQEQQQAITDAFTPTSMLSGEDLPEEGILSSMMMGSQYAPRKNKSDSLKDYPEQERELHQAPDVQELLNTLNPQEKGLHRPGTDSFTKKNRPSIYGE